MVDTKKGQNDTIRWHVKWSWHRPRITYNMWNWSNNHQMLQLETHTHRGQRRNLTNAFSASKSRKKNYRNKVKHSETKRKERNTFRSLNGWMKDNVRISHILEEISLHSAQWQNNTTEWMKSRHEIRKRWTQGFCHCCCCCFGASLSVMKQITFQRIQN